jgi:phage-related protein
MNIKKELVSTFRNLLSAYFGKVYSDSEVKISDRIVGGVVEIIAPDGTLSPAIDGEYLMEDGFTFTVKDGKIESIIGSDGQPIVEIQPEEMTDYTEPSITGETTETKMDITEDVVNIESSLFEIYNRVMEQENKIKMLEEKMMSIEEAHKNMTSSNLESQKAVETFNKVVTELNNNIKTLASVPVQFSKTDLSTKAADDRQEKMNDLVAILNSNKK